MSFPLVFEFGSFTVTAHAVLEALAFFIGFRYFLFLRKKEGDHYNTSSRIWVIIGAIFGALIGSRLLGSLERPAELSMTDDIVMYIYSNKTVVGGFLGGLFGVELVKNLIGEKKSSGDLFVYPMILALVIGRLGCFSMGVFEETYGLPSLLPWAMDLGDGISRHPVTLYEIAFLIILWILLKRLQKKSPPEQGGLFKLFMISYLAFRFLLDFIKPHYPVILGLSSIQLACFGGLIYYLPFIIQPIKRKVYA